MVRIDDDGRVDAIYAGNQTATKSDDDSAGSRTLY